MPIKRRGGVRGAAGLVAVLFAVTALAITPALGAQFLTKQKADKRYLGNTTAVTSTVIVPDMDGTAIAVMCPSGQQATGGGATSPAFLANEMGDPDGMLIAERKPILSGVRSVGWVTEVLNVGTSPLAITGYAVCAP